ncbi:MAG: hypothetical protein AB1758_30535 [Candidatus Eremiobacterota bacterium]
MNWILEFQALENRLPATLDELAPGYLKRTPVCPGAGFSTYAYETDGKGFTVYCRGWHHGWAGLKPNQPLLDYRN